jgi:hypothetical protein
MNSQIDFLSISGAQPQFKWKDRREAVFPALRDLTEA